MEEELAQLKREADTKSAETPHLRKKLYQTHVEMLEAIRTQELQMQNLSDIIPALDMVHSSLISSISIDPVRLQSHQSTAQPKVPLMSAANFEVFHSPEILAPTSGRCARCLRCCFSGKMTSPAIVQGISLSSSLRGLPKPQRQYVPVRSVVCYSACILPSLAPTLPHQSMPALSIGSPAI